MSGRRRRVGLGDQHAGHGRDGRPCSASTHDRQRRHTSWPSSRKRVCGLNSPGPERRAVGQLGVLADGPRRHRPGSRPRRGRTRTAACRRTARRQPGGGGRRSGWYGVKVPRYHSGSSPPTGVHTEPPNWADQLLGGPPSRPGRNQNRARSSLPGPACGAWPGTRGARRCSGSARRRGGCRRPRSVHAATRRSNAARSP